MIQILNLRMWKSISRCRKWPIWEFAASCITFILNFKFNYTTMSQFQLNRMSRWDSQKSDTRFSHFHVQHANAAMWSKIGIDQFSFSCALCNGAMRPLIFQRDVSLALNQCRKWNGKTRMMEMSSKQMDSLINFTLFVAAAPYNVRSRALYLTVSKTHLRADIVSVVGNEKLYLKLRKLTTRLFSASS